MPNHLLSSHTSSRSGTRLIGLIGWVVLVFAVAAPGAAATIDAAAFYASLAKPDWAPPAWLFGPVWSLLYGLMGIAAWLVWRSPRPRAMAFGQCSRPIRAARVDDEHFIGKTHALQAGFQLRGRIERDDRNGKRLTHDWHL